VLNQVQKFRANVRENQGVISYPANETNQSMIAISFRDAVLPKFGA